MTTPERQALSAAINDLQAARENLANAEQVLQKAKNLHCSLSAQVAEYDDLDSNIAQARAENLKLALATGETHALADAPEGFASAKVACYRATMEMQAVGESIPVLEADLESAREVCARRAFDRDMAAESVFAAEFGKLAEDYNARLIDIRAMSYAMNVGAYVQVARNPATANAPADNSPKPYYGAGPTRRVQMPPVVYQALQDNCLGLHEQRNGFGLRDKAQAAVQQFWQALQNDPNAELALKAESNNNRQSSFDSAHTESVL